MAHIFISYNREDRDRAEHFVRGFKAAGIEVWWDASLQAGEVYDEITENALREAGAVVVLWSRRAVASRWVRAEATLAQRLGSFVPCMIEPCERPIMFELTQTADLAHWQGEVEDPAWQNFVSHVQTVMRRRAGGEPKPPKAAFRPSSERRQITFLAAEIAGGDALATSLDPEEWHELLTGLRPAIGPVVTRFDGTASWSRHGFTATFGYPVAHEDAAQRAVGAALALQTEIRRLGTNPRLDLRIGIHTSEVLVTDAGDGGTEMFGNGEAIAARLRDAAPDGAILVSGAVAQLTAGSFLLDPAGSYDAEEYYRVEGMQTAPRATRGWASATRTRFVGREDELELITSRWKRVLGGSSQYVLVRGEPGIGKSRLVEQFEASLAGTEHYWITLQGAAMFANTPWHALEQFVRSQAEGGGPDLTAAVQAWINGMSLPAELASLIVQTLGLDGGGAGPVETPALDRQRSRLLGMLLQGLFELAERKPLVLFADDLQWIDPSTLELIELLIAQAEADRILIVATARPEFRQPWPEREHHSRINLGRLSEAEVGSLVAEALGEGAAAATVKSLVERAEGVPLFAEELARMLAASRGEARDESLPPTLRALLSARMDRLGPLREVLQVAAVLGRSFTWPLIASVTGIADDTLEPMLDQLGDEQLLIARGAPPFASYRFKHALLQDAAYESLPKKRQREFHRKTAETIVADFPEIVESQRELLASHWTRAGETAEAIGAWTAAGNAARQRAAPREAAAHFRNALDLVGKLPEDEHRDSIELDLWSKLNRALQVARGYADPATAQAAKRAFELAKKSGALGRVLIEDAQQWRAAITAGDYSRADAIRLRVLELGAQMQPDEVPRWLPYFETNALVQTTFYAAPVGLFERFEKFWDAWLAVIEDSTLKRNVADDTITTGLGAWAAWMSGRTDLAFERLDKALAIAKDSGQAYPVAVSHHFAATLCSFEQDYEATRSHSLKAIEVSEANGFDYILRISRAKLGWAAPPEQITADDIAAMRSSLQEMEDNDALVGIILVMNRLAMALEAIGQIDEAVAVTERALVFNPQESVARPQTLEIRGRLHAAQGEREQAIACYRKGLDFARERRLLAPALSLAVRLAQALQDSGDSKGARTMLEATLADCNEDTNTPALQPARVLLHQLAA